MDKVVAKWLCLSICENSDTGSIEKLIILYNCSLPLTKKKLSKQADVAGIDKGSSNPRHELGPVA